MLLHCMNEFFIVCISAQKFASEEDVYSRLVESFAPSIWEMDDIKRGILCQLFGGTLQADLQVRLLNYDMHAGSADTAMYSWTAIF